MVLFLILNDNYCLVKRDRTVPQSGSWSIEVKRPILKTRFIRIEVPNDSSSVDALHSIVPNLSKARICQMNLLINLPVEIVAQLFSCWLNVPEVCKIEIALGSAQHGPNLIAIYQSSTLQLNACRLPKSEAKQIDWFIRRGVKISQLHAPSSLSATDCDKVVVLLSHSASLVTSVTITGAPPNGNRHVGLILSALSVCCKHLQCIRIAGCELPDTFWQLLARSCFLINLTIDNCTAPLNSKWDVHCSSVQGLRIINEVECELEVALQKICDHMTLYKRTKADLADLGGLSSTVKTVIVKECRDTSMKGDDGFALPAGLTKIEMLLSSVELYDLRDMLTKCPNLIHLNISGVNCMGFDESIICDIGNAYWKTLRKLQVVQCTHVTEASLKQLCLQCLHLEHLDISMNKHLPESVYGTVLNSSPALRCFHVNFMNISDHALRRIAEAPLEMLGMKFSKGYTEEGLMALVDGCTRLKRICVAGNVIVTPLLQRLWFRVRPNLVFLDEPYSRLLT